MYANVTETALSFTPRFAKRASFSLIKRLSVFNQVKFYYIYSFNDTNIFFKPANQPKSIDSGISVYCTVSAQVPEK